MRLNLFELFGLFCLIAALVGLLFVRGCEGRKMDRTGNHSRKAASIVPVPVPLDTERVAVIEPIRPIAPVVAPTLTRLQNKPDLPRRKQLEKHSPIITGIRKDANTLAIQTIDPKGIVKENEYLGEWVQLGKWEIDSTGLLRIDPVEFAADQRKARRKKFWGKAWRTTKTVVISTAFGVAAYQVGKSIQ